MIEDDLATHNNPQFSKMSQPADTEEATTKKPNKGSVIQIHAGKYVTNKGAWLDADETWYGEDEADTASVIVLQDKGRN